MSKSLEDIRRLKKKYEKEWLRIPRVQAVGVGVTAEGKQGIVISVVRVDESLKQQLPEEIEGVPVELRQGGPFSAQ